MRIITGKAKNIQLVSRDNGTRPLSDRAKTALFNILQPIIEGSDVLDIYAGTGALGLEAISRGAKHATFVDISRQSIEDITFNINRTRFKDQTDIIKEDALKFTEKYIYEKYNIIFVCPPYPHVNVKVVKNAVNLLCDGGILVFEHHKKDKFNNPEGVEKIDTREYGIVQFEIFKKI